MATSIKRIYELSSDNDGYRVLVDRLWPRGISKDKAHVGQWLKEVGPSNELRNWFGHDPTKWEQFKKRYEAELKTNPAFEQLQKIVRDNKIVTLVYSAKDEDHNQAQVLLGLL